VANENVVQALEYLERDKGKASGVGALYSSPGQYLPRLAGRTALDSDLIVPIRWQGTLLTHPCRKPDI